MHYYNNKKTCLFLCLLQIVAITVAAQNYHAVQGSSFAGSLGVANNPASIVNTPYPWDITIFSFQIKNATNAISIKNYSLLSSPANAGVSAKEGNYGRYAAINTNLHLLNLRLAINRTHAVAFGLNLRGYGRVKTSTYNYIDSLPTLNDFFTINQGNPAFNGKMTSSSWIEIFATYSQTVWDDGTHRLNAGITLKGMRGISGAFASLDNAIINPDINNNELQYFLNKGSLEYAYSGNYDKWQTDRATQQNLHDFLQYSQGGLSADLGVEYLIKKQTVHTIYSRDDYFEYDWKIGISLLDIGSNQYKYSSESRIAARPKTNITGDVLQQKFMAVQDIRSFNDTLATVVNSFALPRGTFKITNPTRLVINADKTLNNDFYINGEISFNLTPIISRKKLYTEEMNFITITPRWETRRWGVYLPIQYNAEKKFWIGLAGKIGPLLIGVHNLGNIFSKDKMQNGGGYLALVIRPWGNKLTKVKQDKRLECSQPVFLKKK